MKGGLRGLKLRGHKSAKTRDRHLYGDDHSSNHISSLAPLIQLS